MSTQALKAAATGTAPAKPATQLQHFLERYKGQFAAALPKHLNPDRMIRLAMTAFNANRSLQECDMQSIAASIVLASQLGLEIGVAGQGYLVPYKKKCQFIPGWQGYVDLVSRSGRATVWTGAAFEGDDFEYALGDSPFVRHRPCGEDDPKKLIYVYSIGRVNGSQWPVIEVWPIARVWKHRDRNNKVGSAHYSFGHPEMYARKVPLLQVVKYMPKSIELSNALTADHALESGHTYSIIGDTVYVDTDSGPVPIDGSMGAQSGTGEITSADVIRAIEASTTIDELDVAADSIRMLPDDQRGPANEAHRARRVALTTD